MPTTRNVARILKKIAATIAGIVLGLLLSVFALNVFVFGWEGAWAVLTFHHKVATIREQMFNKGPEELARIVVDARRLMEISRASIADVEADPMVFDYLAARRVVVKVDSVYISLAFMMDTGASLWVKQEPDGSWVLSGSFGEDAPVELLWPIERRAR